MIGAPFCVGPASRSTHPRGRYKPEGERGLRGNYDLLVSGKGRACRTCASSSQSTDKCALAATGKTANDGTEAAATACQYRGALAFTLFDAIDRAGFHVQGAATGIDGIQPDHQRRLALEAAQRLGGNNRSTRRRTGANHRTAAYDDRAGHRGGEGLARLADLGAQRLIHSDADMGSTRNDQGNRRGWRSRRCCRSRSRSWRRSGSRSWRGSHLRRRSRCCCRSRLCRSRGTRVCRLLPCCIRRLLLLRVLLRGAGLFGLLLAATCRQKYRRERERKKDGSKLKPIYLHGVLCDAGYLEGSFLIPSASNIHRKRSRAPHRADTLLNKRACQRPAR